MEKQLEIIKAIQKLNPNSLVTGTIALKLHGIDLGREPGDIDILINDYAPNIKMPSDLYSIHITSTASDGMGAKFDFDGCKVDVLSNDTEEFDIINGIKCSKVAPILRAKKLYSKQTLGDPTKHDKDIEKIEKLGYNVEPVSNVGFDDDGYPFCG